MHDRVLLLAVMRGKIARSVKLGEFIAILVMLGQRRLHVMQITRREISPNPFAADRMLSGGRR